MKKVTVNHSHSLLIDFKSIISICLSVSFLLAFILPASASVGDDFSDCEDECTDTPFELSYEEGDLPLQELKTAVLNAEDVPSFLANSENISFHVNRVRAQEPDNKTIVFQNRDGSKTYYYCSVDVKMDGEDLSLDEIFNNISASTPSIKEENNTLTITSPNILLSRLFSSEKEHPVRSYSIGYAELVSVSPSVTQTVDVTTSLRNFAGGEEVSPIEFGFETEEPIESMDGLLYLTYTNSELTGVIGIRNDYTNKVLYYNTTTSSLMMRTMSNISGPAKWIVSYYDLGPFSYYMLSPVNAQYLFLTINYTYGTVGMGDNYLYAQWNVETEGTSSFFLTPVYDHTYAMNDEFEMVYATNYNFDGDCLWRYEGRQDYVPLQSISVPTMIEVSPYENIEDFCTLNPDNPTFLDLCWFDGDTDEALSTENGYCLEQSGFYTIYCKDLYSGISSNLIGVYVSNQLQFTGIANRTYAIRPYYSSNTSFTQHYLTFGDAITGANTVSVSTYVHPKSNKYSAKWTDASQTFTIETNPTTGSQKIASTLCANQYTANGNVVPTFTGSEAEYNASAPGCNYTMVYQSDVPNYLCSSSGTAVGHMKEHIKTDWIIIDKGVACVVNGVTLKKYSFVQIEVNQGNTVVYGLWHDTNISTPSTSICTYSDNSSAFEWTIVEIGINCPLIKQTNSIYCGFATLLQIMYGAGTADCLTNSNRLHNQMVVLTNNSHAGSAPMNQAYIEGYLNNQDRFTDGSFDNENYMYTRIDNISSQSSTSIIQHIINSLDTGWAPFMKTNQLEKPYGYKTNSFINSNAHYICICGYDPISQCVTISNCHFSSNAYGIYAINISDFFNKLISSGATTELFYAIER